MKVRRITRSSRCGQYSFPLSPPDAAKLAKELQGIPPLLAQAQLNLTGNARDLWMAGIGTIKQQRADLLALERQTTDNGPELQAGDPGRTAGDVALHHVAGATGAVEERPVGRRQGELHLEPAQRAPRAADVG